MNSLAKIFLIDDDKNIVFIFKEYLTSIGHKIIDCAFNGEEAIQKFKNLYEIPDLVLMDYRMPFKNGIQTTKEILNINPQTNIMFVSADSTVREEVINLGVNSFLEKPIDLSKLRAKINAALQ